MMYGLEYIIGFNGGWTQFVQNRICIEICRPFRQNVDETGEANILRIIRTSNLVRTITCKKM